MKKNNKHINEDLVVNQEIQQQIDLQKMQSSLEISYSKYKELYETAPVGYFIFDINGTILKVNQTGASILNLSKETLLGMNFFQFLEENQRERLRKNWEDLKNSNKVSLEISILINEKKIWLQIESTIIEEIKSNIIVSAIVLDITHRKNTEQQLAILTSAVEQSANTIVITDLSGSIIYVNNKFVETTGYTKEEALGKNPRILKSGRFSSADYENLWQTIVAGDNWKGEFHNKKKNGELYWESALITPIKNSEGVIQFFLAIKEDNTQRKLIEEKLQQTENIFKTITLSAQDAIIMIDNDGLVNFWNPAAEKILGYTADEILGRNLHEIITPKELRQSHKEAFVIWQKTGTGNAIGHTLELEAIHKNSNLIQIELSLSSVLIDGKWNAIGILRDISERKKIEAILAESEEKHRRITENTFDLIAEIDMQGNYLFLNPVHEEILGYSPSFLLNKNFFSFIHPENINTLKHNLIKDKWIGTLRYLHLNGEWIWLEASSKRYSVKNEQRIIIICRDISDRKKAEIELFNQKENLRSTLASLDDMVSTINNEGIFVSHHQPRHFNQFFPAACEFIGRNYHELFPANITQELEKTIETVNQKLFSQYFEFEMQKNNSKYWFGCKISLRQNFDGQPIGTTLVISDISKQKNAEIEMNNALEKEKELNALKSRFISTVSHEFRTPMAGILSSANLLEKFQDKWDNEKKSHFFRQITDAIQHLTILLDDVALIAKDGEGKLIYNPKNFELYPLCVELIQQLTVIDEYKHPIKFSYHIDEKEQFYADKLLIRHIISNLLSNAIKYSAPEKEIMLLIQYRNNGIEIIVQDQGIGIAKEDYDRLFESFHRGKNAENIQGTGLGLPIVKRCVDLHKGEIHIESKENVGSKFIVWLPIIHNKNN